MKKYFVGLFMTLLLLIPIISGCGSEGSISNENGEDASSPTDQEESNNDSLDALVEDLMAGERAPGQVIVQLQDGVTEEEAYQIFAAHGFDRESVDSSYTQYVPHTYLLHFSEEERDIESVIKELLLDPNVESASANFAVDFL